MSASPVAAKRPRLLRRWRWPLLAIGLPLLGGLVLLCTAGWPWVNETGRRWAEGRLVAQLDDSVEELPEISDYAALRQQDVRGTNGWPHVVEGCRLLRELIDKHPPDYDAPGRFDWEDVVTSGFSEPERLTLNGEADREIPANDLSAIIDETAPLLTCAAAAAGCDCIVDVDGEGPPWSTHARPDDYFGALATRVVILDRLARKTQADSELRTLVTALSKVCPRGSKDWANYWKRTGNEILEHCALPRLRAASAHSPRRALLAGLRWTTPGNDPKLWLNNAALIYRYLNDAVRDGRGQDIYGLGDDMPDVFPAIDLHSTPGFIDLMEVVTENALDARSGKLDLRDPAWVKSYHFDFDIGWHPVNGVVGCGHETMNHLVAEIKREDKLWDEIEALVAAP